MIAAAVEAKTATGHGHRRIAARLGRPVSTVRGWLRAFAASAGPIVEVFTALSHRYGADAAELWPAPAPAPAGRALAGRALAAAAYAGVLAARFSVATLAWQSAGLAAAGPWFFSASGWVGREQHELALMPGTPGQPHQTRQIQDTTTPGKILEIFHCFTSRPFFKVGPDQAAIYHQSGLKSD
ncbi:helix-turn-helix domain-containing protein [Arthrobacter sp. U41]|uniref:helix-turn-helix domain-containing protein n=1 Tax=Arthrobacter sp. U41 TaxID=1849032 RepID=UPI0018D4C03D|nr:helix-turn-helix domain-containing protein [Arthrobacter sp. U41]